MTPQGKQVSIAHSPTNYSAGNAQLESHLSGIDTALGTCIHDNTANEITGISLKAAPVDDDVILIEDSEASYVKKRVLLSAISGSGTHASSHITGGGDEIDGDKLDIDWNPSNYTPTTDPSEVDSVDNLTAHLAGINDALVVEVGGGLETIAYVDSTQADAGSGATLTLTKPTGVQDGDLLLAVIVVENDATQTWDTVPSGWTLLVDSYATGGSPATPPSCSVWYKVASSEGSSYDWVLNASGLGIVGAMLAYRNVDNSTPLDATRTLAQGDNSQNPNPPSIDTVTNGAFVVAIAFHDDDSGLDSMSSGYAEREEVADASGGNGATLGVCDDEIVSAGTEDPGTFQNSGSDSEEWGAITIALRPATTAPTTYTLASHAARHVQGGGDEVDGDELDIDFTPSNYTPASGSPGSDVDHLAAHLRGIDDFLGTTAALTSTAPVNVTKAAAAVGVGTTAARHDHKHDITTASASANPPGTNSTEGSASSLARSDHTHELAAFGTGSGTFCQGNDSRLSNDRTASGLRTASTVVSISGATAPSAGQVLVATSSTTATWQTPATGGGAAPVEIYPMSLCDQNAWQVQNSDAYGAPIVTAAAMTVAYAYVNVQQAAASTCQVGIYAISGTTATRVAQTDTVSCSTTGLKQLTFTTPYEMAAGTMYYIMMTSADTPRFAGVSTAALNNMPYASARLSANNDLPSSGTLNTNNQGMAWIALSA